ncbi:MAG: hypothetical protein ACOCY1_05740, partial [Halovenus sp.]
SVPFGTETYVGGTERGRPLDPSQTKQGPWFERREASFVITRERSSLERQRVSGGRADGGFLVVCVYGPE